MAGLRTLDPPVEVRVLLSQPTLPAQKYRGFDLYEPPVRIFTPLEQNQPRRFSHPSIHRNHVLWNHPLLVQCVDPFQPMHSGENQEKLAAVFQQPRQPRHEPGEVFFRKGACVPALLLAVRPSTLEEKVGRIARQHIRKGDLRCLGQMGNVGLHERNHLLHPVLLRSLLEWHREGRLHIDSHTRPSPPACQRETDKTGSTPGFHE